MEMELLQRSYFFFFFLLKSARNTAHSRASKHTHTHDMSPRRWWRRCPTMARAATKKWSERKIKIFVGRWCRYWSEKVIRCTHYTYRTVCGWMCVCVCLRWWVLELVAVEYHYRMLDDGATLWWTVHHSCSNRKTHTHTHTFDHRNKRRTQK